MMAEHVDLKAIVAIVNQTSNGVDHPLAACRLWLEPQEVAAPHLVRAQVDAFVRAFPNAEGWLCFQSGIRHFTDGAVPDDGVIQYAELGAGKHGLLVRRAPNSGWRVIAVEEGRGSEVIGQDCRHVGRRDLWGNRNIALVYRRYWRHDADYGCLPHMARFVGFDVTGGDL